VQPGDAGHNLMAQVAAGTVGALEEDLEDDRLAAEDIEYSATESDGPYSDEEEDLEDEPGMGRGGAQPPPPPPPPSGGQQGYGGGSMAEDDDDDGRGVSFAPSTAGGAEGEDAGGWSPAKHAQGGGGGEEGSPAPVAAGGYGALAAGKYSRTGSAGRRATKDSRALKAKYLSTPRVTRGEMRLYTRWLNSLRIWNTPGVDPAHAVVNPHEQMCSGLLLCALMKHLVPGTEYKQLNLKPLSRKPAVSNIEQALAVIFQKGTGVNHRRIATSDEIYKGKSPVKVGLMLREIFNVFVLREIFKRTRPMLRWLDAIVEAYGQPLSATTMAPLGEERMRARDFPSSAYDALWHDMRGGTLLFLVIRHYCGEGTMVGRAGIPVDSRRMRCDPATPAERQANARYVFALLKALDATVVWGSDQWVTTPSTPFLLFQLDAIFQHFKGATPAQPGQGQDAAQPVWREDLAAAALADVEHSDALLANMAQMENEMQLGDDDEEDAAPGVKGPRQYLAEVLSDKNFAEKPTGWNTSALTIKNKGDGLSYDRNTERRNSMLQNPNRSATGHVGAAEAGEAGASQSVTGIVAPTPEDRAAAMQAQLAGLEEQRQQLDIDRQLRDLDLQREEVALETDYYNLGDMVQELQPDEYDTQLDGLERRRFALEEQRRAFEDDFGAREVQLNVQVAQAQAATQTPIPSSAPSSAVGSSSPSGRAAPQAARAPTGRPTVARAVKKDRERGWNSNTQKRTTQNRALRQRRQLRAEYRQQQGEAAPPGSSAPLSLESMHRSPAMHSSPAASPSAHSAAGSPMSHHAPSPMSHHSPAASSVGGASAASGMAPDTLELQRAIAAEERRLMAIEEERKWREYEADVLGGGGADDGADLASVQPSPMHAASPAHAPPSPAMGGAAEIEVEVPRNAAELSEATEWLKVPRKLWLRERNSESDMIFAVVGEGAFTGEAAYQLQWSLPSTPREIEGFVSLADIATVKAVPTDPTCFSLVLRGHNPQAVRNSGGLHAVNVRTTSPSECAMYRSGLLGLHSLMQ